MQGMHSLLNYLLHIDSYLLAFVSVYGTWTYVALFMIIFCETGLVITPFLPGDSLLFVAGSIAAQPESPLSALLLFFLLIFASIIGNQLNYLIGRTLGTRVFSARNSWLFNKKHLEKTHRFYEKHGGKTIILARFIPIIRTFAPFVAGIGEMKSSHFSLYNIISAFLWISLLLGCGYFFGSIPIIKENFSIVIYSIIIISLMPPAMAFFYRKLKNPRLYE
ncbi:DedA family protein [Legionella fairfieldensis]|uniref:DedA family protein n=1 Tax=Legionella fairfieldensis TaxID=45064 RepID=UPI0004921B72|nr:DedA family protein [Legionella fairfieldensis]